MQAMQNLIAITGHILIINVWCCKNNDLLKDSLEYETGEKKILSLATFPRTDTNQKGWGGVAISTNYTN